MKTPDEIKEALGCHASDFSYNGCCICPYFDGEECEGKLALDAKAYINQLEETISLMKIQMRGDCGCCKHGKVNMKRCNECLASKGYHPMWEYEGLPEVNAHE